MIACIILNYICIYLRPELSGRENTLFKDYTKIE